MSRGNPLGLGIVVAGAVLVAVSTFLPLCEAAGPFNRVQQNTLIQHDGWMYLVGAVALAGAGFRAYLKVKDWYNPLVISIIGVLGVLVWAFNSDLRTLYPVGPDGDPITTGATQIADWGIAIYVAGAGVLLGVLGSFMLRQNVETRQQKQCPDCAESVLAAAQVCKHCGYRFPAERDGASYLPPSSDGETRKVKCFSCTHVQEVWSDATVVPCEQCGARMKIKPRAAG